MPFLHQIETFYIHNIKMISIAFSSIQMRSFLLGEVEFEKYWGSAPLVRIIHLSEIEACILAKSPDTVRLIDLCSDRYGVLTCLSLRLALNAQ